MMIKPVVTKGENPEEVIKRLEKEIAETPHHKGTDHHLGRLKAKIARLKEEKQNQLFRRHRGGRGGFAMKKTGEATIVLVGPPSVGKSTLLNQLTNAESKVGDYDFTTLNVIPGMMAYRGAKIQLLDLPGIIRGAALGKGKGKEILAVARAADLILIIVDPKTLNQVKEIKKEINEAGIRLNQKKPQVIINKKPAGGLKINASSNLKLSEVTIRALCEELRLVNAEITINENIAAEQMIDTMLGNRVYLPSLTILNKSDLADSLDVDLAISALKQINLEKLREKIWQKLKLIRVYSYADRQEPFIIKQGKSLKELINDFMPGKIEIYKEAKIWGPGAKFPGQLVSLSFCPLDGTIVQFI
ncbi:MAG: GTPase [Candidatus Shapirobacteria bacterium]